MLNKLFICYINSYATSVYNEKNNEGNVEELTAKRPKKVEEIDLNQQGNKYKNNTRNNPFLLWDEK